MSSQDFDINAAIRPQNTATPDTQPQFGIQRIYIKDLSFEAPHAPEIFRTDWTPDVNLDLDTGISQVSEDVYEVVLKVTVTVKAKEKTAFLIEVKQAGIFSIKSFPNHQLQPTLASYCPNILFPYAREVISDIVNRGTFPPLYLAPVNFNVLYQQYLAQQNQEQNQQTPATQPKETLEEV